MNSMLPPQVAPQLSGQNFTDNISLVEQMEPQQPEILKRQARVYTQQTYRWVILALVSLAFTINNLSNNAIIPIASKIIKVYQLNQTYANLPIQLSFLINPIMNFSVGHFMDKKGLGISFRIGALFYAVGMFGYTLINYGYHFVLIGSILIALGQPLIMNSPAKIATFWFLNNNRAFATGVINAINIVTLGISLVFPAIFVHESSQGDAAKEQIFSLYSKYFLAGVANCILIMIFMRQRPQRLPSAGAQKQKTSFVATLNIIKKDKNLWKFFAGSMLLYGTFLSFGSTSNLLFKPYGFQDTQIALFGVSLLISGILGSIIFTYYIKRTLKYKRVIVVACSCAMSFIILNSILLTFVPEQRVLITFMILGMGFNLLPMVPISHDLGCQLAFPVGQAQVVGIMTGGAMIYTVILTLSITSFVGFGTTGQSGVNLIIYVALFGLGSFIYSMVDIDLKRRQMQLQKQSEHLQGAGMQIGLTSRIPHSQLSSTDINLITPLKKKDSEGQDMIKIEPVARIAHGTQQNNTKMFIATPQKSAKAKKTKDTPKKIE